EQRPAYKGPDAQVLHEADELIAGTGHKKAAHDPGCQRVCSKGWPDPLEEDQGNLGDRCKGVPDESDGGQVGIVTEEDVKGIRLTGGGVSDDAVVTQREGSRRR